MRSRTNTSRLPLVSPATRLVASELNATNRPSAERDGSSLMLLGRTPSGPTLTSSVATPAQAWLEPAAATTRQAAASMAVFLRLDIGSLGWRLAADPVPRRRNMGWAGRTSLAEWPMYGCNRRKTPI